MSKIYEALENAYRARARTDDLLTVPQSDKAVQELVLVDMEEELLGLYKNIEILLPHSSKKVIQFIGSKQGEGASTIVREFARVAATRIGMSVLLLDADRLQPSQHLHFKVTSGYTWQEAIRDGESPEKVLHRVGETSLFLGPSANTNAYTPEIFDSPRFAGFWETLWQQFDLILVDSPPLGSSPDGLAIAPRVSGVVLVVEAEKTRWQIVRNSKERITKVGGNVLGIVFNKRRYYIPELIYKHL